VVFAVLLVWRAGNWIIAIDSYKHSLVVKRRHDEILYHTIIYRIDVTLFD